MLRKSLTEMGNSLTLPIGLIFLLYRETREMCYQAWIVKPWMLAQSKKWWPYFSEDTRQAMIDLICKAFQGDSYAKQRAVSFFNLGSLHFKFNNEVIALGYFLFFYRSFIDGISAHGWPLYVDL